MLFAFPEALEAEKNEMLMGLDVVLYFGKFFICK